MQSWTSPAIPTLPGRGHALRLHDTATQRTVDPAADGVGRLYVCGITPYDSTHLGHAFTYVAFDTLLRVWRDAGVEASYVQNVTDVDDPLLERAEAIGVPWRDLAADQVALFRSDMTTLRVLPPTHYVGVVEAMDLVVDAVERLIAAGAAYWVDRDVYADITADPQFGSVGHLDDATMAALFAERGGDPQRSGKRHPLDPLLWRGERAGEPAWDGRTLGSGRPGWHIECGAIAAEYLGLPISVQGGGEDLIFPHHEMGTSHLRYLGSGSDGAESTEEPIRAFVHTGLVGYDGHKMSKSRGNLIFVSRLTADGVDPAAIRLTLLSRHYRSTWEFTDHHLDEGTARLQRWRAAVAGRDSADAVRTDADEVHLERLRAALAQDLDTPRALEIVDAWAADDATELLADAVDALLGVDLRSA
ncbi:cysteine--1-D-myo-inosityl 2-amino-2-deoxy-alpha-D-glucopyranoside ligase [Ruania halotolerans]|uniref:cysteine--1-D-myo-inosityl 2-amino-2-deoxy-alpha-D-glucopyranoside ligase n=1 Tax=Ruania halotolerans TaxID=2897773 RepID=UPI001E4AAB73|nr:cysteine--1-D-myo-inosityl 2-amino-2-deoxy-alpha-D-glucopyranoside ligase [Ruania halotolerans]UFU08074.1 cysteine--1-D-myo-inosityl 2-amino-2-deoxy-alpha-D-glucopyranoside ligase [Ruania halotolerans]